MDTERDKRFMMDGITVITPTGDRPLAFSLCEMWIALQTRKPDQWIVVDDGRVPTVPTIPCDYVRRQPTPLDPQHTLNMNVFTSLQHIKYNKIMIFEDDDYYAPGYIAEMERRLALGEIVGMGWAKYYHIPSGGYTQLDNGYHASWAQTAFRESVIPAVEACTQEKDEHYLDIRVWRRYGGSLHSSPLSPEGHPVGATGHTFLDVNNLQVGIKGLPGRYGIGDGHNQGMYISYDDINLGVLKSWIPLHYQAYLNVCPIKLTKERFMGKYVAKETGFLHSHGLIERGQVFDFDGPPPPWATPIMVKVEQPVHVPAPAPTLEPNTMFEMTKVRAAATGALPPVGGATNKMPNAVPTPNVDVVAAKAKAKAKGKGKK